MNVIIANKYKNELNNLNIDIIKKMDGEFDVETICDTFKNFYFNRLIIDITAIKDSFDISVIQKLCSNLDSSKIILFLTSDPRYNNMYMSKIISLGIYNFTKELSAVKYLIDNPNSYRDVAQYHDLAVNDEKNLNQPQRNNSQNNYSWVFPQNQNNNLVNNEEVNYNNYNSNFTGNTIILGFKDLTYDAGSTSLIYMLKKQLKGKNVLAVEINSNDFSYFNDSELMSVSLNQIPNLKNKFSQFDIVLIDLNNSNLENDGTCTDIIYLLEPSTIKLNKLIRRDKNAILRLKDKKIVLNKSLLTLDDMREFEYEAKAKMFYNIPPLDERKDEQMVLSAFLEKLGIYNTGNQGNFFNIFKKD